MKLYRCVDEDLLTGVCVERGGVMRCRYCEGRCVPERDANGVQLEGTPTLTYAAPESL